MKIYTKTGDAGETSLVYGVRIGKDDLRVEAYGSCDEANSFLGLALSQLPAVQQWQSLREAIQLIQTKLFHIGAELSTPPGKVVNWPITAEDVAFLEEQIDLLDNRLPPLQTFILPGGHPAASALHVARTVVRRAERRVVQLQRQQEISQQVGPYLNRLSDFLFVAARAVNQGMGVADVRLHEQK